MGIISEIHPNDGKLTVGPIRDEDADDLPGFVDHHTKNPPRGVTLVPNISDDGLTATWSIDWVDGDEDALQNATEWSAKVQAKAAKAFRWGGSG